MKIAVFASSDVGVAIINFLKSINYKISYLIVNSSDASLIKLTLVNTAIHDQVFFSAGFNSLPLSKGDFDLGILCWWPYLIKESLLNLPTIGYLNFHPSYLPFNRGKGPNAWTFLEDTPFGVTIHWVDSSIDGGDIAFQTEIHKTWEDTAETLYYKAKSAIVDLFKENFKAIVSGNIPRIKQFKKTKVRFLKELNQISIDLNKRYTAREFINLVRAKTFSGYSGCWFEENGQRYQLNFQIKKLTDEKKT